MTLCFSLWLTFATTAQWSRTFHNLYYFVSAECFGVCGIICQRDWAEGSELPFSDVSCGKNCLSHLFDGNVWSSGTALLEEEDGFGPAAAIFGWRNSNLKLRLLKKPVHNLVCFLFFFFPPLSWNKLPAILCGLQVSRLPFTRSDSYSLPDSWGLHLKCCRRGRALQWSWQSYSGYLLHLQAAASPFVWTTENGIPGALMWVGLPIIEKKRKLQRL